MLCDGILPFCDFFVEEEEFEEIVIEPNWIGWILGAKPKIISKAKPKEKNWIEKLLSCDDANMDSLNDMNTHNLIEAKDVDEKFDFSLHFNMFLTVLLFLTIFFSALITFKILKWLIVRLARWILNRYEDPLEVDMFEYHKEVIENLVKKQMGMYKTGIRENFTDKQRERFHKESFLIQEYFNCMDKFLNVVSAFEQQITSENSKEMKSLKENYKELHDGGQNKVVHTGYSHF